MGERILSHMNKNAKDSKKTQEDEMKKRMESQAEIKAAWQEQVALHEQQQRTHM
eukprot:NODE_13465_length_257_cov_13.024038_g12552_i0.p2 GENE.NODE_13465_length_257_cov_13.024038_g12552_i0~~NODE_13465_length_257_cov_13.024038_g12552_i0.p2  ORF type:complete len:62 (-),score=24.64 NODE_13465_length_257_cov_13.024038_g12552_i0:72-233(-)